MLREAVEHLKRPTSLETIYFVLFDAKALATFEKELRLMSERGDLNDTPVSSS
jgi:hypothetical protein